MDLTSLFEWIQRTDLAVAVRQGEQLFPWLESVHVLAITAVVGTITIVDLRLLGLASRQRAASAVMADVLPYTRGAFAVAVLTGLVLFASHASEYIHKAPFVAKMILLVVAGINIGVFHLIIARGVGAWDTVAQPPAVVKAAGAVSLGLWIAIVACGRWIGFV